METNKELKQAFAWEILCLLQEITQDNFYQYYDKMEAIVLAYKAKGLSKSDVMEVLTDNIKERKYLDIDLNDFQEEVIIEIEARLVGYCPTYRRLDW